MLVEVIGELGLCVVLGGYPPVEIGNAQSITVKNDRQNAIDHNRRLATVLAGGGDCVNLAGTGKLVVGAGTLPIGNGLAGLHFGVNVMESVGLEVNISRPDELGQIDSVLEVVGGETLLLADVEQSGHSGHAVAVKANLESGIANELRVGDGPVSGERLGKSLVVEIEQVDGLYATGRGKVAGVGVVGLYGFDNHIVDGSHDERIHANGQRLLRLILEHGDKGVQLLSIGERLLHLALGDGAVNLKSGSLVEELGGRLGLSEDVGVVTLTVGQFPRRVLGRYGHFAGDFLQNRAVLPAVHQDRGGGTGVRPVDENHLADVVDKCFDKRVEGIGVENLIANVNDVGQIFLYDSGLAKDFLHDSVGKSRYLIHFHNKFLLIISVDCTAKVIYRKDKILVAILKNLREKVPAPQVKFLAQ